jgi:hypothetical protein
MITREKKSTFICGICLKSKKNKHATNYCLTEKNLELVQKKYSTAILSTEKFLICKKCFDPSFGKVFPFILVDFQETSVSFQILKTLFDETIANTYFLIELNSLLINSNISNLLEHWKFKKPQVEITKDGVIFLCNLNQGHELCCQKKLFFPHKGDTFQFYITTTQSDETIKMTELWDNRILITETL